MDDLMWSLRVTKKISDGIVLSVKPYWANLIMEERKTVELRRRFSTSLSPNTIALIYSSSPISSISGVARVESVFHGELGDIWEKTRKYNCVDENSYRKYFEGLTSAFAIFLKSPRRISPVIPLDYLRKEYAFTPPVSWRWLNPTEAELLRAL